MQNYSVPTILVWLFAISQLLYLGCFLHAILVYSGLVTLVTKKSPKWFFGGVKEAMLAAFVTRSSSGVGKVTGSSPSRRRR